MNAKIGGKIFVSAHVSEVYGPVQALKHYLKARGDSFTFVEHPFPYTSLEASFSETYVKGKKVETRRGLSRWSFAPAQFKLNFFSTIMLGLRGEKSKLFIGIGNLNALAGLVLKALGRVERVGYYVIDHTPRRFENPLMDWLYAWVDRRCCENCDFLWCLSHRIIKAKVERGAPLEKCLLCPVGVQLEDVKLVPPSKRRLQVLVVMSHLTKEKGVQLVLESFGEISLAYPKARLEIIGTGPYESELRRQAAALKLGSKVKFLGLMNHQQLFAYLPTCGISLATYTEDEDNIAYYADPTKPKEYLACGLPMIITRVPWTWELVADKKKPMGIAINYTGPELVAAAGKLLKDRRFYLSCRANALTFARTLAWGKIFDKAFADAGALP